MNKGGEEMQETQYLTVTALTKYLKRKFEADPYLERVFLTAEISNYRLRTNAHQYFSLKDEKAKISAVMFKQSFQQLKFQPEEGMKVLVVGRISLYEASGNYQIYVEHMEPAGVGALYQAYEELKKKLTQQGMFKAEHKQLLPKYPKKIAVVTSPSGAVIRDIITTVKRRYPIAQLVLFPTLVQGDRAANDIVRQIKRVERSGEYDVMLVARGGGSIEDLWPFNEEGVAQAIFEARTPIISSVGHETDTTIADLVADVRAATPTAAAELATPVLTDELLKIKERQMKLVQVMSYRIQKEQQNVGHLTQSIVFKQPQRLYEPYALKVDDLKRKLLHTLERRLVEQEKEYLALKQRLQLLNLTERLNANQVTVNYHQEKLNQSMEHLMKKKRQDFEQLMGHLDLLSPLKTMTRGYSYVSYQDNIITDSKQLEKGDQLTVTLAKGSIRATVDETNVESE